MTSFEDLGLAPAILTALAELGYEEPTPIQRVAIPALLAGRDVLGQAATGTGKTAAFTLPLLQRLMVDAPAAPARSARALVLVPTRELAMQVSEAVHRYGRALGVRAAPIYGGQPIERQIRMLRAGVDVVVATPGRALDHLRRRSISFEAVEVVVLDEADEMLDMGFAEDLEAILAETPAARQTALFSATMPDRIAAIAARHLREPQRIDVAHEAVGDVPRVRQVAYVVARAHKVAALVRVLDVERPSMALVFCRTRVDVDVLTEALKARGFVAEALHGGLSQDQRDRVMGRFRSGATELLCATDVAARGLDVRGLSHVVNHDMPADPDDYVHRIGRTGRAGGVGVAITLVEPREHRLLRDIERQTRQRIELLRIPTVADLRARKLELTSAALREALLEGDLDGFRVIVDSLSQEFDVVDIALAAVKLAHRAHAAGDDSGEIPQPAPPPTRTSAKAKAKPKGKVGAGATRARDGLPPPARGANPRRTKAAARIPAGRLFIGAGREQGVRPGDLVGAIANEAGLAGRDIGAIQIGERFSIVEIPEEVLDEVVARLKRTVIKGKKVVIRRDRTAD